jgi:ATP-dependent Clp protease ATP-binding subunit ClpA
MARIPTRSVSKSDRDRLQGLESDLRGVIYGQESAIRQVVDSIKLSRAGLGHPDKPIGSFLFSGPTGVGKTELAKQLARNLGIEFLRFDMSEYMEKHTVSRLIGAPPGYVGFDQGGLLTDAIRKTPYAVLVLDEIEKAHPDLFNLLLQVMDHGVLTDANGKKVDFRNVVLIMTTNAGAADSQRNVIGFGRGKAEGEDEAAIKRIFSPEFRNRRDSVVAFKPLTADIIRQVVHKFVMQLEVQLADRGVTIELADDAADWLAKNGFDELYGARPLARVIQEHIKMPLADELLFGKLVKGGHVKVKLIDGKIGFDIETGKGGTSATETDEAEPEMAG